MKSTKKLFMATVFCFVAIFAMHANVDGSIAFYPGVGFGYANSGIKSSDELLEAEFNVNSFNGVIDFMMVLNKSNVDFLYGVGIGPQIGKSSSDTKWVLQ